MKPTNITLLDPKTIVPGIFKPIETSDVFDGMSRNLNDGGLYSVEIFGRVGSNARDETEGYIDTILPIFNPTYLKALVQLKSLYMGIIKGTEYAQWDESEEDFIKSDILNGDTGFSFFMRYYPRLNPKQTGSYKRKQKIELLEKEKAKDLTTKVLVIPAGLRDIQFSPNGEVTEPEINELYRKLFFRTRSVTGVTPEEYDNPLYDNVRWGLQQSFNNVDGLLFDMSQGKGGIMQAKVSTRGVAGGTRNIITARQVTRPRLFDYNGVNPNSTDIGIYQALMANHYVCIHALLTGFLESVFTVGSTTAKLVNTKTLEYEYVELNSTVIDKWITPEGLIKLFNGYADPHLRNRVIKISGYYLGLVYDDGKEVRILSDINDLPEGRSKKHVTPMTYTEFFYINCYKALIEQMQQQTRYPITGLGSIAPSVPNLLTITGATDRMLLDIYWEPDSKIMRYPHKTDHPDYFDAMSVDQSREAGYGSDHDGDNVM